MCSKLNRIHQTIEDCSDSLKINRKYYKAILLRAQCYKQLCKYKESIKDYKAALKIQKTDDIKCELAQAESEYANIKYNEYKRRQKPKKNHYQVLNINETASDDDIRRAYKNLAKIHHPDRHANATEDDKRKQTEIFKEISNAYEVLSDPRKRFEYDMCL